MGFRHLPQLSPAAELFVINLVAQHCQSASRVKLIRGFSSTSKVEDLWITRLGTAYCSPTLFSLIVVTLCVMQNSSHLLTTTNPCPR
jgi:hypothetical protein